MASKEDNVTSQSAGEGTAVSSEDSPADDTVPAAVDNVPATPGDDQWVSFEKPTEGEHHTIVVQRVVSLKPEPEARQPRLPRLLPTHRDIADGVFKKTAGIRNIISDSRRVSEDLVRIRRDMYLMDLEIERFKSAYFDDSREKKTSSSNRP